jgi:hypothetical protein
MPHPSPSTARHCERLPLFADCESSTANHFAKTTAKRRARRGLTLVEVLIATTITLLMLAALAEGFKRIGDSIADNRAALEVSNRLRGVALRLKEDLEGATVRMIPPADAMSGQGYFEYFEGPMCDYSLTQRIGDKTSSDPTTYAPASRYGDFDDILMLTSRAGNTWYTGKVPRYIIKAARGIPPTFPDDLQSEVIASQYAEIVWYARPHDDPALPNAAGSAVAYDNDLDGAPQLVKLHRRVLLIRPDLNTTTTVSGQTLTTLPNYSAAGSWMIATTSPLVGMHLPHQQCDLSLRRVENPTSGATFDYVAANSLEDLAVRQNRFAHFENPMTNGESMPLLALESAYWFAAGPSPALNSVLNNSLPGAGNLNGPLHPAFVLQDRTDPSLTLNGVAGNALYENRIGEDVIAGFCVGFDLQAFDPQVPLLFLPGGDTVFSGGAAGSDDVIVSPNDPGYAAAMLLNFAPSANLAGTGGFVNLGWMRHVFNEVSTPAPLVTGMTSSALSFESPFSGISVSRLGSARPFSDSLYRSGLFFQDSSVVATASQWGQMTYDTWSNVYEVDGVLQSDTTRFSGPGFLYSGTMQRSSAVGGAWRSIADAGRDGVDNNGNGGADEPEEWETSPPFPSPLRSIKATIRLEEPDTRQLFQEPITVEFVSR